MWDFYLIARAGLTWIKPSWLRHAGAITLGALILTCWDFVLDPAMSQTALPLVLATGRRFRDAPPKLCWLDRYWHTIYDCGSVVEKYAAESGSLAAESWLFI